jgi:hypothetical protein
MDDPDYQTILAWSTLVTKSVVYDPTGVAVVLSTPDIVLSFEFSILDIVLSFESSILDIVLSYEFSSLRIAPFSVFSNLGIGHGYLVHRP